MYVREAADDTLKVFAAATHQDVHRTGAVEAGVDAAELWVATEVPKVKRAPLASEGKYFRAFVLPLSHLRTRTCTYVYIYMYMHMCCMYIHLQSITMETQFSHLIIEETGGATA